MGTSGFNEVGQEAAMSLGILEAPAAVEDAGIPVRSALQVTAELKSSPKEHSEGILDVLIVSSYSFCQWRIGEVERPRGTGRRIPLMVGMLRTRLISIL